jgi:class 3 adenylate cyclase/tetratricopeptide (TPR) repeat protein
MFCDNCGIKFDNADQVAIPKLEDMHAQLQSMIPDELAQKYMTAEQQATGENRPITALFADISGFTPLSATKSSEAMFQLVQDCFKQLVGIVARYEGSISGFRGDGLLALFGAPILHENDAERAILAGIEMRDMMHNKGLEVSIGINTAMMTVGEIQTQLHKEYTAYGTDVNLAARLQQNANPGQILVGAGTHRLTRRAFDFEIISDLSLKGFSQTVTAYAVQHVKEHPEKLRGIEGLRARMIGREHEFTEIKESVDQWLSGHGQIVSVIGEAGIGKSRLVSELKTYLHTITPSNTPLHPSQEGNHNPLNPPLLSGNSNSPFERGGWGDLKTLILEGRCVSIGQPISYWPFIDILRTYFNLKEDDDPSTIAKKVTDGTKHIFPNTSDETLPFIGRLLSVRFGNELDDRLKFATPEQIRHQTLMQLRDFFRELAKKQPLLLILEDLHWSDELSLDLITYLLDELSHAPLMLLCVYRPEKEQKVWKLGEQAQRKCLDRYTEINLKRLSSLEGRLLVEELLTIDDLPDSVKNIILEKSEGNPFFIEEVIRSLIEQDMVYRENDRWRARSEIININVPDTIQSVLLSRVDRLQSEARYVLQCASVIGRLFKYSLLDHLTSQERDLNRYLSEFEDRELVYEERRIPELEYAFKHALTQEATYQSILERRRKEFHHQIAVGIEKLYQERLEEYYEELANHYSKSDDVEKAVEYLIKAGQKSVKSYANESAKSYYQDALGMMERQNIKQDEWKLNILIELGKIYNTIGDVIGSEKFYDQAIELAKRMEIPKRKMALLYYLKVCAAPWQLRFDETIYYLNVGLDILGDDKECVEAAIINSLLSICYVNQFKSTQEYVQRNMTFVKKIDYSEICDSAAKEHYSFVFAHIGFFNTHINREPEVAIEYYEFLADLAEKYNDPYGLATALACQGNVLSCKGDYKKAIASFRKAIPLYDKMGYIPEIAGCYYGDGSSPGLMSISIILGNIDEAISYIPIYENVTKQMPEDTLLPILKYNVFGQISMIKGDWDSAITNYKKRLESAEKYNQKRMIGYAHYDLGKAYMEKGDYHSSIDAFIKACHDSFGFAEETANSNSSFLLCGALGLIEKIYTDLGKEDDFNALCSELKAQYKDILDLVRLSQLHLEPIKLIREYIDQDSVYKINESWKWIDGFNDGSYIISKEEIEIQASNGRDLYNLNLSAPRLVYEMPRDFVAEVIIGSVSEDKPQVGGLLIWKDKDNFIRFEKGTYGKREMRMMGYVNGKDQIAGRGLLPASENDETYLRLERSGDEFTSYCSVNGENWFTCGKMTLPMEDPIQVGIHAIGMIDRTIYCGEYKEGTATLFRNFRLWTR